MADAEAALVAGWGAFEGSREQADAALVGSDCEIGSFCLRASSSGAQRVLCVLLAPTVVGHFRLEAADGGVRLLDLEPEYAGPVQFPDVLAAIAHLRAAGPAALGVGLGACIPCVGSAAAALHAAVLAVPGNAECADCGGTEMLTWASLTHGVTLCNMCVGGHRSLGTHVSRVRSLLMDQWTPEEGEALRRRGNAALNARLEAQPAPGAKPAPGACIEHKVAYIESKYLHGAFAAGGDGVLQPWAARTRASSQVTESQVAAGVAFVRVLRARGLPGRPSAYVKVRCGPAGRKAKTRVAPRGADPEWNETLQVRVDEGGGALRVQVVDSNRVGANVPVGECRVELAALEPAAETPLELLLKAGTLHLRVTWCPLEA